MFALGTSSARHEELPHSILFLVPRLVNRSYRKCILCCASIDTGYESIMTLKQSKISVLDSSIVDSTVFLFLSGHFLGFGLATQSCAKKRGCDAKVEAYGKRKPGRFTLAIAHKPEVQQIIPAIIDFLQLKLMQKTVSFYQSLTIQSHSTFRQTSNQHQLVGSGAILCRNQPNSTLQ